MRCGNTEQQRRLSALRAERLTVARYLEAMKYFPVMIFNWVRMYEILMIDD